MSAKLPPIDRSQIYVNFLSGSSGLATPYDVAKVVNKKFYDYLQSNRGIKYLGVVPADFPNDKLIDSIIAVNINSKYALFWIWSFSGNSQKDRSKSKKKLDKLTTVRQVLIECL